MSIRTLPGYPQVVTGFLMKELCWAKQDKMRQFISLKSHQIFNIMLIHKCSSYQKFEYGFL